MINSIYDIINCSEIAYKLQNKVKKAGRDYDVIPK